MHFRWNFNSLVYLCCCLSLLGVWEPNLLLAAPRQRAKAQADQNATKPLPGISVAQTHDILEKIGIANEKLIELSQDEGKLKTSIPENYQEANNIRNQIGQAIQSYGGHSSVSGNNQYECHLISPILSGIIQRKTEAELRLEELKGQRRRLEIVDGAKELRILISNNEDYFLLFHDRREEGLVVQESDADFTFNGKFTDFSDFCLRNTDYCQTRFFPLMKRFGITFPETAFETSVREIIIELLVNDGTQAQEMLTRLGSDIMANEFKQRREALKKMEDIYPANRMSLIRLILDKQQPAEIRHHFMEVLVNKDKPLHQTMKNVILPQDLLNNVPFLLWALKSEESIEQVVVEASSVEAGQQAEQEQEVQETNEQQVETAVEDQDGTGMSNSPSEISQPAVAKDPRAAAQLRQRLAQLTNLPPETSLEVWTELTLGPPPTVASTGTLPTELFSAVDGLSVVEGKLTALLRLVADGKTLKIDREYWKTAFGNKSPREHFQEVHKLMQERSLPTQWLTEPTEFSLDEDVQALVLAERLRADIKERPVNPNNRYYMNQEPQTKSNTCRIDGETMLMVLDMGATPVAISTSPCRLSFVEHGNKKRVIQFVDRPDSDFSLSLRSEESGAYFRLTVKLTGETSLRQFIDNSTVQLTAPSFGEFQRKYPEVTESFVKPLLNIFGSELLSH